MSQAASSEVDFLPFAKFVHAECPTRVRNMLEGLYQHAWPAIAGALQQALAQLDDDLFRHAERAPNVNEQNLSFEGLRELRRRRGEFLAACRDGVQRALLHLVDPAVPVDQLRTVDPAGGRRAQLSLVDPVHLEQVLVLSEVATRAEMRASDELNALAYRLAVVVGTAPFELEAMALAPHSLCACVRAASQCLELGTAHRVSLYRRIDKALFADATGFYEAVNRHLAEQGILAWLQLTPRRLVARIAASPRVPPPERTADAEAGPAPAPPPPEAQVSPGARSTAPRSVTDPSPAPINEVQAAPEAMAGSPAALPAAIAPPTTDAAAATERPLPPPRFEGPAMQALRDHLKAAMPPVADTAPAPDPLPAGPAATVAAPARAAADSADLLSFDTLRELLAGRRHVAQTDATGADTQYPVASVPDIDAALATLQQRGTAAPMQMGGRLVHRSVADVKREILSQLRARGDGTPARLSAPDSDAIDLVGFLFDHLLADQQATSLTNGLLTQLQVPLIKVALKDKGFFTQRNHPARQLLNALVETSELWVEDEAQDAAVVDKMRWVVDRVSQDFSSDTDVFGRLFEDLSRHMGGLKKKAEVAERHYVEAARGKEKLELAREAAIASVKQRLDHAQAPAAVSTLLRSAWTDAVALSFLRLGYDHPRTHERLEFIDRLIELFGHGRPLAERRFELGKLRPVFEEGMAAIGHHDDAVGRAWSDIARLVEESGDESEHAAATAVRELVEQRPRLGGVRQEPEAAAAAAAGSAAATSAEAPRTLLQTLRKDAPLPLGPREAEMAERIKRLPFGTWFEFIVNQQGDKSKRKLCWYSPVTGRCLFVNVRGAKAQERTIDDLARDLVRGNVRLLEENRDNLIDRAWKGIVNMLRGAGLASDARPEEA